MARHGHDTEEKKAPKPVLHKGPTRERPRRPKLRGCRPPRGLCLRAGLHCPNAARGGYSFTGKPV